MNKPDVAALLTIIATLDRRTLGETDVIAWHGVLGDLPFEQCRDAAVTHYATQTDWLMPAHIRSRVLATRQDAAMRALPSSRDELVTKPIWFDDVAAEWKSKTRENNRARADRGERPDYGQTITRPGDGRL